VLNYLILSNYVFYEMNMMFHIGIKMEPFRREDDEDFLQNIIGQGRDGEYDGSEYLNETGHGDANQPGKMVVQDVSVEVYRICTYIYKHLHEFYMYVQCVVNRYFSRHPNRVGNQNGNEGRRKLWRGILSLLRCTLTVNQSLRKV